MSKAVMIITDATCKISAGATVPPDWSAVTDFKCQVSEARLEVNEVTTTSPQTYCPDSPQADHAAASKWVWNLAGLQDWNADSNSLSQFLFDNDASVGWIQVAMPDVTGAGNDISTAYGPITIRAGQWGGPAGSPLEFSTTLPCSAKPTIAKSTVS